MSVEVVKHPETGQPAVVETSYRVIELELEEGKLSDLQAQRDAAATAAEEASNALAALESQLSDQKSLVERAKAIQPATSDEQTDGGSDSPEAEGQAENPAESSDEQGGDAGDGAVEVPVTVEAPAENPADEY